MKTTLRVKICGIKSLPDALAAVEAGADLLGFNFHPPSPRCLSLAECQAICSGLRQALDQAHLPVLVGVFVNPTTTQVSETLDQCGLDLAQLCGDEVPAMLHGLGARGFKALRPANSTDLERLLQTYSPPAASPAWLIDAYHPAEFGGTGRQVDWSLAADLAQSAPILLAGGLTPENVAAAVAQVKPWGVDVASGVESAPGVKDHAKIRAFIQAARSG